MPEKKIIKNEHGHMTPVRTVQREQCLAMLVSMKPIKEIASELKIKPHTIYKWMNEPEFCKKLDRQLALIRTATTQYALELIKPCFETIEQQIADGDGKLALALLKELGSLRSAGGAAGFEQSESSTMPKIVINISGHEGSDNQANIIDIEADKS